MWHHKIVAVYDKAENAIEAVRALKASGIPEADISLLSRDSFGDVKVREARLWRRLFGGNVGDRESVIYGSTVQAGGAVLTLRLPGRDGDRALKAFDMHKPVLAHDCSGGFNTTTPPITRGTNPDPVAEEDVLRRATEVDRGKRQVDRDTTRVRRFVIEKPIKPRVTLHEEQAEIVRQTAADRARNGKAR